MENSPINNPQEPEILDLLQRTRADFENFRKRAEEQKAFAAKLSAESTVRKLLPLLDVMQIAIQNQPELAPLSKTLEKTLSELNISIIKSNPGTVFDPNLHDAISMEDLGGDKEIISESLKPGYMYEGNVIQPAMVKVQATSL